MKTLRNRRLRDDLNELQPLFLLQERAMPGSEFDNICSRCLAQSYLSFKWHSLIELAGDVRLRGLDLGRRVRHCGHEARQALLYEARGAYISCRLIDVVVEPRRSLLMCQRKIVLLPFSITHSGHRVNQAPTNLDVPPVRLDAADSHP